MVIIIITGILIGIIVVYLYIKSKNKAKPQEELSIPSTTQEPVATEPSTTEEAVTEEEDFSDLVDAIVKYFGVDLSRETRTFDYLKLLFRIAYIQYCNKVSDYGIPVIYSKDNFPTPYNYYGELGDPYDCFKTLVGWLFALQLSELKPESRTEFFKRGYQLGDYTRYNSLYGYDFEYDPNDARIIAGILYAAMRGRIRPNINAMRKDVEGTTYVETLAVLADGSRDKVAPEDFFIDFREFMPTAPAPYAPGYTDRPDRTYPNEERDDFDNLEIDRQIHETIVKDYNVKPNEHYQECVQAIADKEADEGHMFGPNRSTKHYHFHPVFGKDTIGIEISPESTIAKLAHDAFSASSSSRGILQSATVNPKQYGRLRPGCSWKQEGCKNSSSDDRRNVLVDFEIEDGDGSPTGYYDQNGNWVYMNGISSPEEFNDKSKNQLYANSYPSGHSAGIMGAAMVLAELMPDKADKILKAANQFAVNRTISRYHWTSDTINGRVLGTATNAVAHASSDYDKLLNEARKELCQKTV